MTSGLSPDI
ncbi:hypothetical protein F383_39040 [Gossypium arboreum]|uniref:Uncharacterized protein n=1 Tax=Gossypium arboreum TaxID=29729 RepID=A0A0B0MEQ2_GOSAR|nr:hypothetical protein F383_39040 [Gossypium arboreum]